jgi:hypothetical protein
MTTQKNKLLKVMKTLSGGEGSDHFSPSQLLLSTAKWMINYYCCTQAMRRQSIASYKMLFGILTNNTVQKLIAKYLFVGDKRIELTPRSKDEIFAEELEQINKQKIRDNKDKWSRENMIEFAKPCIEQTLKAVKEIFGLQKLQCERYVHTSPDGLFMDILGRIDYESDNLFAEMKSKPPYVRAGKNGFSLYTQKLPEQPDENHLAQVAFYWKATKKRPYLFYVNDKEYKIFDYTNEKLTFDYLDYVYDKLVKKALMIQRLLLLSDGDPKVMAQYVEEPDYNHPYYYKDLTPEQIEITKQLWG